MHTLFWYERPNGASVEFDGQSTTQENEEAPLLGNDPVSQRFPHIFPYPRSTSSVTRSTVDSLDSLLLESEHDNGKWFFQLLDWDEILKTSALHSTYDGITLEDSEDIGVYQKFNYFRSSLMHTDGSRSVTPSNRLHIFETLFDKVAQARLQSLRGALDELATSKDDPSFRHFAIDSILAHIVSFELNPNTIRDIIYKSIIAEFDYRCRPKVYRKVISFSNWVMYLLFFGIHFLWLKVIWVHFIHDWTYKDKHVSSDKSNSHTNTGGEDADISAHVSVDSDVDVDSDANSQNLMKSFHLNEHGSPLTILDTIMHFTYYQWIVVIVFCVLLIYLIALFVISYRIEKFGNFLDKLISTKLFKPNYRPRYGAMGVNMQQDVDHEDPFLEYEHDGPPGPTPFFPDEMQGGVEDGTFLEHGNDAFAMHVQDVTGTNMDHYQTNPQIQAILARYRGNTYTNEYGGDGTAVMTAENVDDMERMLKKLQTKIESIYYHREQLLLFSVISMIKMFILILYVSVLLVHALVPHPRYWYLWPLVIEIFAFYVLFCTIYSLMKKHCGHFLKEMNMDLSLSDNDSYGYLPIDDENQAELQHETQVMNPHIHHFHPHLVSALTDGLWTNEWVVTAVNLCGMLAMILTTCHALSQYFTDYHKFRHSRIHYMEVLASVNIVWMLLQIVMWKKRYYGTIFFLMLAVPTLLMASSAYYVIYEFFVLSVMHLFLGIIFALGEFHLIGDYDDPTTLDPTDWTLLGVLALLARVFRFRLPEFHMRAMPA